MIEILTIALVLLAPLQVIGIPVGTTIFDLSNILCVILAMVLLLLGALRGLPAYRAVLYIVFASANAIMLLSNSVPGYRFASSALWFAVYTITIESTQRFNIRVTAISTIVFLWACMTVAILFVQFWGLGLGRPSATFSEPSVCGLYLVAVAAGVMLAGGFSKELPRTWRALVVGALLVTAFWIRSTHIFSFLFALVIFYYFVFRISGWLRLALLPLLALSLLFIVSDAHFAERLNLVAPEDNLSVLSWLRGFEQMVASSRSHPVFGTGLGSTGYFDFSSEYSDALDRLSIADLNLYDAYSGLFRLIIEAGPLFTGLILLVCGVRLYRLAVWSRSARTSKMSEADRSIVFLTVFGFTLIVGILLKEPTFTRSTVALAIVTFFCPVLESQFAGAGEFIERVTNCGDFTESEV